MAEQLATGLVDTIGGLATNAQAPVTNAQVQGAVLEMLDELAKSAGLEGWTEARNLLDAEAIRQTLAMNQGIREVLDLQPFPLPVLFPKNGRTTHTGAIR